MKKPVIKKIEIDEYKLDEKTLKKLNVWDDFVEKKIKEYVPDKIITINMENSFMFANAVRVTAERDIPGAALDVENVIIKSTDQNIGIWSKHNIPHIPLAPDCPVGTRFAIKVKAGDSRVKVTSKYLKNVSNNGWNKWHKDFYICYLEANHSLEITNICVSHGKGIDHIKYSQIRGPVKYKMLDYVNVYYLNRLGFIEQNRRIISTCAIMKKIGSKATIEKILTARILISNKSWENRMHSVDKKIFDSMDYVIYFDKDVTKLFKSSVNMMAQDYRITFQVTAITNPKDFTVKIFEVLENKFNSIITSINLKDSNKVLHIKLSNNLHKYEIFGEDHIISNLIKYGIYQEDNTIQQLNTDFCFKSPKKKFSITIGHPSAHKLMITVLNNWKKYIGEIKKQLIKTI